MEEQLEDSPTLAYKSFSMRFDRPLALLSFSGSPLWLTQAKPFWYCSQYEQTSEGGSHLACYHRQGLSGPVTAVARENEATVDPVLSGIVPTGVGRKYRTDNDTIPAR